MERADSIFSPAAPPPAEPSLPSLPGSAEAQAFPRGPDRRRRPTSRWSRYALWGGRRRGPRRDEELEGSFVDQYSGRLFILMIWIGMMNIGDSFFTLFHLQAGGIELNPFAAMLLGTGRTGFVVTKSLLISIPLLVLCLHKNFHLARVGLWVAASCYSLLFAYHVWLL